MSAWMALAPLITVGVGGLVAMMVDALDRGRADLALLSTVVCVAASTTAGAVWYAGLPAVAPEVISTYLAVDGLTQFFHIVIGAGAALSALLAGGYLPEHGIERGEYYVILLFSAFGAMVLAAATDLLTVFIGLETMSLGVYCLVSYRRGNARSAEAGLKYFLLGSFAAAILLFGSALLYGATGHTDFVGIGKAVHEGHAAPPLLLLGLAMVLVGLAFKVSAVPFHMWTPDAYEGAVTPATTFMAVAVKVAAFASLVRLFATAFSDPLAANPSSGWPAALALLAAVTMVWGNAAAAMQASVKRMLAYSSVAHAGYLLVGLAALSGAREMAASGVLYYLAAYTVSNVLAFGSLIALGTYRNEAVSYADLVGAGRRHPMAGLAFALGVLSLMGFPPTAGFFGKWYVFNAALAAGDHLVWVVVLGVLTSVVGGYYYLRVVVVMFMQSPAEGAPIAVPMRSSYVVTALVVAAFFVVKMGVTPQNYVELALAAARGLGG